MTPLAIEPRPDGSLLLTHTGGARWGVAVLGLAVGGAMLAAVMTSGGVTPLGGVVALPLGVIVLLAGLAAVRHRDWILFDRRARQVVHRRGLASVFRSARAFSFDEVEAIIVDHEGDDGVAVRLCRVDDSRWPVDHSRDPAHATRLAWAIHDAAGWPVLRDGVRERGPSRSEPAGSR